MTIWIIMLFACPPQGGQCEQLGPYPGRFADEKYCERVAGDYRSRGEGDRWMRKPGWSPLFSCVHLPQNRDGAESHA